MLWNQISRTNPRHDCERIACPKVTKEKKGNNAADKMKGVKESLSSKMKDKDGLLSKMEEEETEKMGMMSHVGLVPDEAQPHE
eukprot:4867962-Karenia_brevis.AAC.1